MAPADSPCSQRFISNPKNAPVAVTTRLSGSPETASGQIDLVRQSLKRVTQLCSAKV